MSGDEAPPSRAGSTADISRRLERVEERQDEQAKEQSAMRETIARVEANQKNAEELNALRHEALKTGLTNLTGTLGQFITRIEGIIDGSIQTAQTRQGAQIMADYLKWHDRVEAHIDTSERIHENAAGKQEGIVFALTGGRAILVTLLAAAAPVIALIGLLNR